MTCTTLTEKECALIKELRAQEQLCAEKYTRYANQACDGQLRNLFTQIAQTENEHIQTLDRLSSGTVPQMNAGGQQKQQQAIQPSTCSEQDKQNDAFLCADALAMEKHVSAEYNTCIFEFSQAEVRDVLNHIQKEEQEHGKQIYDYMSVNGMY